ncbi:MAG: hypothetical protein KA451_10030 [Methyloversatilis sp.]|nr:hypothetical protein [Methyloversatilis sp.]MBP6194726.1 hypothetical protein [Methyloversatilis sp.]
MTASASSAATPPAALLENIGHDCAQPVAPELQLLSARMCERFGASTAAVLFYGACLRSGDPADGLVDLYVLVDRYADAYPGVTLRFANVCLPPNVFTLQARTASGRTLQAKYAVLSLADFEAGTTGWFQSYVWGRFAQPSRLVYSRDEDVRRRVTTALAQAVLRLLRQTLPCMADRFDAADIWRCGLTLSYGTEMRPESADRPLQLAERHAPWFERLTAVAAPAVAGMQTVAPGVYGNRLSPEARRRGQRQWRLRRLQGKPLQVLRLMKSAFTFNNGIDYLAWKLERHTGHPVEVTPRLRRHPLIFGWPLLWRLLRERRLR